MRRDHCRSQVCTKFVAAVAALGLVLAGGVAAAQTKDELREKLKQDIQKRLKQRRAAMEQKSAPAKQTAAKSTAAKQTDKKTPARTARHSDSYNPAAAAIKSSEIDRMLESELTKMNVELSPVINDADFLRRAYLDLTGRPPTPDKLDAFVKSTDPEKRSKVIDELLETDEYAQHWARYWRDVISYHAIEQRSRLAAASFEDWLTGELKKNTHWDDVATQIVTVTGDHEANGAVYFYAAQFDQENTPVNLAAETSRVFLGIQIACAQCHDHPYDDWKREQFHEMAAFFARTRVLFRLQEDRKFVVFSPDNPASLGGQQNEIMKRAGRRGGEYMMPDKDDPEKKTRVDPQFLLGQAIPPGQNDTQRRTSLAEFITDKSNPWFAKAYVNRIWGELMGEGFYEPVDDLGPGRDPRFPLVVNRLATAWRASDYDVKWLFRLVMNTEAYQREIRPRDPSPGSVPFAAVCPTRLSADQIFDSLVAALGIDEAAAMRAMPRGTGQPGMRGAGGVRGLFGLQFGVDPSTPTEDVQGTIPQALFFMNSPLINQTINASGDTMLGRWLTVYTDDDEVIQLMYKRVLARAPSEAEIKTCKEHVQEVGNRNEAFEDLLWALVNSTEFITKR